MIATILILSMVSYDRKPGLSPPVAPITVEHISRSVLLVHAECGIDAIHHPYASFVEKDYLDVRRRVIVFHRTKKGSEYRATIDYDLLEAKRAELTVFVSCMGIETWRLNLKPKRKSNEHN